MCVFFYAHIKSGEKMPRNQFQRMVFAFLTVVGTVHSYVFYSLYVVNGGILKEITGTTSVLAAVNAQGGVMLAGKMLPIWAIVIIEFAFAYLLEIFVGSPPVYSLSVLGAALILSSIFICCIRISIPSLRLLPVVP